MNRKGIVATLLTIQIVLILITAFTLAISEKEEFDIQNRYQRIAAYRMMSSFEDISYDIEYLKDINSTNSTINDYIYFVNETFQDYFVVDIKVNQSFLKITDSEVEMTKWGNI